MARAGYIILERDGFRCVYCGFSPMDGDEVVLSVDHIVPVALGGSDRADNLVTCCESCNYQKQAKPLEPETRAHVLRMARERNAKRSIPDDLTINLGSTSAEKRIRRKWETLPIRVLMFAFGLIAPDHSQRASRGFSISRALCFAAGMIPEYIRETGDLERAESVQQALLDMAAYVRRRTADIPETEQMRQWSYRWVNDVLSEGNDEYSASEYFLEDFVNLYRRRALEPMIERLKGNVTG